MLCAVVAGKLEDTLKRLRRNSPTRKHHNDGKLHIPSNRLVHTLERRNVIGNNNNFFLYFILANAQVKTQNLITREKSKWIGKYGNWKSVPWLIRETIKGKEFGVVSGPGYTRSYFIGCLLGLIGRLVAEWTATVDDPQGLIVSLTDTTSDRVT
jgi:hypothetical protein